MALADGSNSRASSLTLRPARANSMIRRRYSAGYGGWVCGMGILLLAFSPTPSTKTGQLHAALVARCGGYRASAGLNDAARARDDRRRKGVQLLAGRSSAV